MASKEDKKIMTDEELLKRQRKGARITAIIVAIIALAFFTFTIYMNSK